MTKFDYILAKLQKQPLGAQQVSDPHVSPEIEPTPEDKPKRERRARVGPTVPTPGGEARAHAEAWLQAVRVWEVKASQGIVFGDGPARSNTGRMQVVAVGSLGGPPGGAFAMSKVSTPIGWLSERAVGEAITRSGEPCLLRLQKGGGPSTLIDQSGRWRTDREATLACAAAVLALAVGLGDGEAQRHLEVVKRTQP